ncbi:MAG: hypothetical protein H6561_22775 [Lewinellaceae bacterium]|nr:hypothetical protein [Saprospiraceae bacterium]MCB9272366.1 hypothetical protein [Lewinellaceae bacterium]
MNSYQDVLKANLPRLINLYEQNPASAYTGIGDRMHVGWKMQDFANGTYQGGVHALAIAIKLNLVSNADAILNLIDQIIRGISVIMHSDGSLDEAYPSERSFCVTALAAFDALSALHLLEDRVLEKDRDEYLAIIHPLIGHLENNDEHHAIISNHLATAVAAIVLWNKHSDEQCTRYRYFLDRIYKHQSEEGWFMEYEGADPGYQTLCTYYLAAAQEHLQDETLAAALDRSIRFLSYFIHPDGSIGGLYGSRNTEVFYPGGLMYLSAFNPMCNSIMSFMEHPEHHQVQVTPSAIDAGNFIPLLNAYAFAAYHYHEEKAMDTDLPCTRNFEKSFSEAGIFIKSTDQYYAITNFKKGGTVKIYNKKDKSLDVEDGGLLGYLVNNTRFSTQMYDQMQSFSDRTIHTRFYLINDAMPTPFKFLILRGLSITLFKSLRFGTIFKKKIVGMLMTSKKPITGIAQRSFHFNEEEVVIREDITPPKGLKSIGHVGKFRAIHMASSGYHAHVILQKKPSAHSQFLRIESHVH